MWSSTCSLRRATLQTDRPADPGARPAVRRVLFEKSVEAQRILHFSRREAQQLGNLDNGLDRHIAQTLVDDVLARQGHGLPPRRVAAESRP